MQTEQERAKLSFRELELTLNVRDACSPAGKAYSHKEKKRSKSNPTLRKVIHELRRLQKQVKGKQKARESATNSTDETNYSWVLGVKV